MCINWFELYCHTIGLDLETCAISHPIILYGSISLENQYGLQLFIMWSDYFQILQNCTRIPYIEEKEDNSLELYMKYNI